MNLAVKMVREIGSRKETLVVLSTTMTWSGSGSGLGLGLE